MRNYRLIKAGIRQQKNGIAIVETKIEDIQVPCKNCGERPRAERSSRCGRCSEDYKVWKFEQERLKKRVEEASRKIN